MKKKKTIKDSQEIQKYDYIIIGAGMGGLSTAAFLAKEGKKCLVLEKHDKPGGFVTSFTLKGCQFDVGIEGLVELNKNEVVSQFIEYWGEDIKTHDRKENLLVMVEDRSYYLGNGFVMEDLIGYFPDEENNIRKFFALNERMLKEMYSGGPPKPPYEMSLLEKIKFGMNSWMKKPTFMRYGLKDAKPVLEKLFQNPDLISIIFSKGLSNMVYMAYAYRWETTAKNRVLYPTGGMQVIADTTVKTIEKHGSRLLLNTEVKEILFDKDEAVGVLCCDGKKYFANSVISNASVPFTLDILAKGQPKLDPLRKVVSQKPVFTGAMINFVGIDSKYDFQGNNYIAILDENTAFLDVKEYTPENCPLALVVCEKSAHQKNQSLVVLAAVGYDYQKNWKAEREQDGIPNIKRGEKYRQLKKDANEI
ncbi:MAG: FAD-dependent oxidoreductase, partial [Spirochaetia bacterium]|nr:FAD-dependent oxidoreductase [Spirochaetia bacterium]